MQYTCVSSAYWWEETPWWRIMSPRGALYIVCSTSKESWGTPQVKRQLADRSLTMDTNCVFFLLGTMWTTDKPKWQSDNPKAVEQPLEENMMVYCIKLGRQVEHQQDHAVTLLSSIELRISFLTLNKADSVLWATLIYRPTGKAQVDCSHSDDWQLGRLKLFRITL